MTWQKGDTYTLASLGWLKQAAAGGVSDEPSITLALVGPTTVTVTFTKPSDPDFASATLYRRKVGDASWTTVTTFLDSDTYSDTVDAECTYVYVAVPANADGVFGPPSREAAIRTVSSASVSGLYSIPIDAIRTLIANCPTAQTFLGVDNEADALTRIYPFIAGDVAEGAATGAGTGVLTDTGATFITNNVLAGNLVAVRTGTNKAAATTVLSVDSETQLTLADATLAVASGDAYLVFVSRPFIVIEPTPGGVTHEVLAQSTLLPRNGNTYDVYFEASITSGNEAAGKQAHAWYGFGNDVGAIVDELLSLAGTDDGTHVYIPVQSAQVAQGPGRPTRDDAAISGHAYGVLIQLELL